MYEDREEKKTEKIFPSELGIWMTCRKKWLFDYMKRKKKLPISSSNKGPVTPKSATS